MGCMRNLEILKVIVSWYIQFTRGSIKGERVAVPNYVPRCLDFVFGQVMRVGECTEVREGRIETK